MSLDPEAVTEGAARLRVLAHPARLRVAFFLMEGECAVGGIEEALGIRQPSLSQYLGELREAGLITGRREGRTIFYRVTPGHAEQLLGLLRQGFGGAGAPQAQPVMATPSPAKPTGLTRRLTPAATFAVVEER
ncbi:metalloregulator ArsR/SmtB family transcription factor [Tistrella mobilis]|uniref:ArsR/SmtB family transcription factor n=1 Tax=Tistrella mobilis TaxID=171437 RepID=UPI0009ECF072|nr:metalloregulator ArsR/SmtB family transcription factor [Tistrella mobilis]